MRFMFVGDSMTIGAAGDYTLRYRMWQHLRTHLGEPFSIVGPRTALHEKSTETASSYDYADPSFPERARRHLAGWGEGWIHMAPVIADEVTSHRPDVLLVSLGLTDLGFYGTAGKAEGNLRAFIANARTANPDIAAVLLPVIPNTRADLDPDFAGECEEFNTRMAKAVADLDSPASPLLLASRPAAYSILLHTYDGTHPNASGEHLLAAAFADAMHQAWGLGAPYDAV